jgi:predicted dehydrogenase
MPARDNPPCRFAVIGAGVIGRRHTAWLRQLGGSEVIGLADPAPEAERFAQEQGLAWFADHRRLLDERPDGVIVAVPNQLHRPIGLDCIERRLPMLMEKPVADTLEAAQALASAARDTGVPVLVGHYRRHSPIVQQARRIIESGRLGRIVAVSLRLMFTKPAAYFAPEWRRMEGGGPILINFIHDIDLLRFLLGEVSTVQATASSAVRGFAVEDTAAIVMTFQSGAIATALLSDTVASPDSWDLNAGEESTFPIYGRDAYLVGGTNASLSLPSLDLWSYPGTKGWNETLVQERTEMPKGNPYVLQAAHFLRVVKREVPPLVTAEDATRTLAVALAIGRAATTGAATSVDPFEPS